VAVVHDGTAFHGIITKIDMIAWLRNRQAQGLPR
jgi:hypothetical protein